MNTKGMKCLKMKTTELQFWENTREKMEVDNNEKKERDKKGSRK